MSEALTVTVFGSLHYDIIVRGPALPRTGETLAGFDWQPACGGKGGNQAVAVARAGVRPAMIGAVGGDDFGRRLRDHLDTRGVDTGHVHIVCEAMSGMSVALFDGEGDYGAVIVSGVNLRLGAGQVAAAAGRLASTDLLLLQNEIPEAANIAAARAVRARGGRVLLNAAPARPLSEAFSALVDILVVNVIEAELLAAMPVVDTLDSAAVAARQLARHYPEAIVTAGGAGLAYASRTGEALVLPAVAVTVASTHGAGDVFIGTLAAALARGQAMAEALTLANQTAAAHVATPPDKR